jgi:hypothetical protein
MLFETREIRVLKVSSGERLIAYAVWGPGGHAKRCATMKEAFDCLFGDYKAIGDDAVAFQLFSDLNVIEEGGKEVQVGSASEGTMLQIDWGSELECLAFNAEGQLVGRGPDYALTLQALQKAVPWTAHWKLAS